MLSIGSLMGHLWSAHRPHLCCHRGFACATLSETCPSPEENWKESAWTHHRTICLMPYALDAFMNWEALALAEVPTPSLITHRHMIWAVWAWPLTSSRPRDHDIHTSHISRAKVMLWLLACTHILHWSYAELSLTLSTQNIILQWIFGYTQ